MAESRIVADVFVPDLGLGAGITLQGFRACVRGGAQCCTIVRGFDRALGEEGRAVITGLNGLVQAFAATGRRKLILSMPACARVTADELSLVGMFAAAQEGQSAARDAYLLWLLATAPSRTIIELVDGIANSFDRHGIAIKTPVIEHKTTANVQETQAVTVLHHAVHA